jgi:signal transduction histidine kinase
VRQASDGRSLKLRLTVAGLISICVALVVAFFGLSLLFERHVERRSTAELRLHLDQIIAGLRVNALGKLSLERDPVDPRFSRPLSGLYWQVTAGSQALRSRSLWDSDLALPVIKPGDPVILETPGPNTRMVMLLVREVAPSQRLGGKAVVVAVALDRSEIEEATAAFRRDIAPYLGVLGGLLLLGSWLQIHLGLRPLDALTARISEIRQGQRQRIGGTFPREITPLTRQVDQLLGERDQQVRRAREYAADFAHGLKTPLQALSGDVERLRKRGEPEIADDITGLIRTMRHQVDRQLARARMAGKSSAVAEIRPAVDLLVSVLQRTPAGQFIDWQVDIAEGLKARIDADDLKEMLGNILENAARYATSDVAITASRTGNVILVVVSDDGPGIPDDKLELVIVRGGRLDQSSHGAGLGLSISTDIAEAAGGALSLKNINPGLQVTATIPAV